MSNLATITSGPSTSAPSDGSRTQTIHTNQPRADEDPANPSRDQGDASHGMLRLRGGPRSRPVVVWREDVVDNENMGKKSSKICCIYHKTRKFGESSSEESSSDSDSDSECDHAHHRHRHHRSVNGNGEAEKDRDGEGAQVEELESDNEPNAYERPSGWKRSKGKRKANT